MQPLRIVPRLHSLPCAVLPDTGMLGPRQIILAGQLAQLGPHLALFAPRSPPPQQARQGPPMMHVTSPTPLLCSASASSVWSCWEGHARTAANRSCRLAGTTWPTRAAAVVGWLPCPPIPLPAFLARAHCLDGGVFCDRVFCSNNDRGEEGGGPQDPKQDPPTRRV